MNSIARVIGRLLGVLINKQIITKDEAKYILHPYETEEEE